MSDAMEWQNRYKTHVAYAKANPEWMQMANRVFSDAHDGKTHQHAIATLLEEAFRMGVAGTPPEFIEPPPPRLQNGVLRRSSAPPPPTAPPPLVRRVRTPIEPSAPASPPLRRRTAAPQPEPPPLRRRTR